MLPNLHEGIQAQMLLSNVVSVYRHAVQGHHLHRQICTPSKDIQHQVPLNTLMALLLLDLIRTLSKDIQYLVAMLEPPCQVTRTMSIEKILVRLTNGPRWGLERVFAKQSDRLAAGCGLQRALMRRPRDAQIVHRR